MHALYNLIIVELLPGIVKRHEYHTYFFVIIQ